MHQRLVGPRPRRSLLADAWPWHHLVCGSCEDDTVDEAARRFVLEDEAHRARHLDPDYQDIAMEGPIDRAHSAQNAPSDVIRAYEQRDPSLIEGGDGLAGTVLVLDAGRRR
ncbi:hypothetical protein [Cellulomonas sp. PS-H5]|uniref:hypothetical protein n=1 Tax=Cellulomonas sp. PS-H5 TaxID=2820400 RepID=UPI001C4E8870|nr:hypothetical protein [Cellulomonas sp. PS-H5]MBW0253740.1 hypothetical protein [Cellulomonas sp. PS-H5]